MKKDLYAGQAARMALGQEMREYAMDVRDTASLIPTHRARLIEVARKIEAFAADHDWAIDHTLGKLDERIAALEKQRP